MADLFGNPDEPARSPREIRRLKRRLADTPAGYAAPPGSGPEGETCRTCEHSTRFEHHPRSWWKCRRVEGRWTGSRRTDIKIGSPACSAWSRDPSLEVGA